MGSNTSNSITKIYDYFEQCLDPTNLFRKRNIILNKKKKKPNQIQTRIAGIEFKSISLITVNGTSNDLSSHNGTSRTTLTEYLMYPILPSPIVHGMNHKRIVHEILNVKKNVKLCRKKSIYRK